MAGFDKQRFVTFLRANVSPQQFGEGRCAKFVRLALADAGLVPASHPVSAKDWGPTLVSLGFVELAAGDTDYQLGDVAVIQGTSESKDGHIQGYDSPARQCRSGISGRARPSATRSPRSWCIAGLINIFLAKCRVSV